MTDFLARRNRQEPTATPTAAETRQETFANAVAVFRQATGKAEARLVPCRCAVTGEPFAIHFERMSPANRFQIAGIERSEAAGHESKTNGGVSQPQATTTVLRRGRIRLDRLRLPALRRPRRNRLLQRMRRNRLRRPGPAVAGRKQGFRLP